jgi:hypothetical protein
MRRTLSLILASVLLVSGLAIAAAGLFRPEGPGLSILWAGVVVAGGVVLLLDEFVLPRWRS